MNRFLLILAALTVILVFDATAQDISDDGPIRDLIGKLDRGDVDTVKKALPDLISRHQNHPGVIYLQARVATDGIEAAKLYQVILDNFPASEWADDALNNLYQYYYAMGLYKTADLKLQQLRKEYPGSEHLTERTPPVMTTPSADSTPGKRVGTVAVDSSLITDSITTPGIRPVIADTSGDGPGITLPYTLQTGAFSTSENAQKQKLFFEDLGYTVEITNRVRGGRSLHLVWVGSYSTADQARTTLREIQSKYNITSIVVER